jgi:hypothetical protein
MGVVRGLGTVWVQVLVLVLVWVLVRVLVLVWVWVLVLVWVWERLSEWDTSGFRLRTKF